MKGKKIIIFASVVSIFSIVVTKSMDLTMLQEAGAFLALTLFLAGCELMIEVSE